MFIKLKNKKIEESLRTGVSFGLTSATITTLGLMVGLNSASNSRLVVIGGILTIAIADAFSDALGIHISEESENQHSHQEIWLSTVFTFLAKFLFALTFVIPVLFFETSLAIAINIFWGLFMLTWLSFKLAILQKEKPIKIISEHLSVAIVVIILTNYTGKIINNFFS